MTKHIEIRQARCTITVPEGVKILEEALEQPIHVYFGVRSGRDHYLVDDFEGLAQRHFNLTFMFVLTYAPWSNPLTNQEIKMLRFYILNMTRGGCAKSVTKALLSVDP